jgi:hypothetical protein
VRVREQPWVLVRVLVQPWVLVLVLVLVRARVQVLP